MISLAIFHGHVKLPEGRLIGMIGHCDLFISHLTISPKNRGSLRFTWTRMEFQERLAGTLGPVDNPFRIIPSSSFGRKERGIYHCWSSCHAYIVTLYPHFC